MLLGAILDSRCSQLHCSRSCEFLQSCDPIRIAVLSKSAAADKEETFFGAGAYSAPPPK
jgi:hypothetical protein